MVQNFTHNKNNGIVITGPTNDFHAISECLRKGKNDAKYEAKNNAINHDQGAPKSIILIQYSLM